MTDPITRTYDPKLIIVTLGAILFTGFADGTFVSIARSGNVFDKRKGADGSVDRINNNAMDYTVTLTLMQTSITNDALSAQLAIDMATNLGKLPLTVKDLNGTTLFFANSTWIEKDPDDEFGDSLGTREWVLGTGVATKYTGGNI